MIVIGLTGSIATGKTTASSMLRRMRLPVFDADAYVHQLMQPGAAAYKAIRDRFPESLEQGRINRQSLGRIVFASSYKLKQLEAILHPLVREAEVAFIKQQKARRRSLCILDIPLLYETGADHLCDATWVTWCPDFLQRQRIMARPSMTTTKYTHIVKHQMPQSEKRRRADSAITSGLGKGVMCKQLVVALRSV